MRAVMSNQCKITFSPKGEKCEFWYEGESVIQMFLKSKRET